MNRTNRFSALVTWGALLTALAPATTTSAILPPSVFDFGRLIGYRTGLVGIDLNGTELEGAPIGEAHLVGVSRSGVLTAKGKVVSVTLAGSRLMPSSGGASLEALVGAELVGLLDDGQTVPLVVAAVERAPENHNKDVILYDVDVAASSGSQPLCGFDDNGARRRAIALAGRWDFSEGTATGGAWVDDPEVFTLACQGFVVAKCVEAGYKPWRKALVCAKGEGCKVVELAAWHQACTRLLRADYCGDGRSHTVDGVPVNLFDNLGVRSDGEAWRTEAEWDANGARCVATVRRPDQVPACFDELVTDDCGDPAHGQDGTLIISEIQ